jgi:hypothetical protein
MPLEASASVEGNTQPQAGAVVARLYRLGVRRVDDRYGILSSQMLTIPIGGNRFKSLQLRPGTYICDAILPSGDLATKEIIVDEPDRTVETIISTAEPTYRWLSWQYLTGTVPRNVSALQERRAQRVRVTLLADPVDPDNGLHIHQTLSAHFAQPDRKARPFPNVSLQSEAGDISPVLEPRMAGGPYNSYVFPLNQVFSGARWYLLVESEARQELLASLPTPWVSSVGGAQTAIADVVVGPLQQEIQGQGQWSSPVQVNASLVVRDAGLATAVAYYVSGDGRAAAAAFDIDESLHHNPDNPLVVTFCGYVLLSQWSPIDELPGWLRRLRWGVALVKSWLGVRSDSRLEWKKWLKTRGEEFGWVPDIAIQEGWIALYNGLTKRNIAKARARLLEGHLRGIPYYTAGVKLLLDGLTLLSNAARDEGRQDLAVNAALLATRRLAIHTELGLPFTTIRLQ